MDVSKEKSCAGVECWMGLTVALGLLPLSFDVGLPEGGDCSEDLLLRVGLVPEVVVVGIALRDSCRVFVSFYVRRMGRLCHRSIRIPDSQIECLLFGATPAKSWVPMEAGF